MLKPIVNPALPYIGRIEGGLQSGKMIRIQGAVESDADRFNINFQTGPVVKPRDDTALHISVRVKQGYIARNSYINHNWGDEQGKGRLPIGPGQQFEIIVLADQSDFKIAVNGQHFCEFPYRIPKERVSHLGIDGDVHITLLSWEGAIPSAPPVEAGDVPRQASKVESESQGTGPHYPTLPQESSQGYGPPIQGGYGPAPPQGGYGPSPQGGYGPPPPQGGYGPPPSGGYGPPPQGYGPPPPPGNQSQSGLDHFLQSAQEVLSDAIASGAVEKLLSNVLGPNRNQGYAPQNAQYGQYPLPQQGNVPQYGGGGSVGGLGGIGSFLGGLASQYATDKHNNPPQQQQQPRDFNNSQSGGDFNFTSFLGNLASQLSTDDSRTNTSPPQQAGPPQRDYNDSSQSSGGFSSFLGSLATQIAGDNRQNPPPPPQQQTGPGRQGEGSGGDLSSIFGSLASQVLNPQHPQGQQGGRGQYGHQN